MEEKLNICYMARVDRSQKLVDLWEKIFPDYFAHMTICQQRNLAIILQNTAKWLKGLTSEKLKDNEIVPETLLRDTAESYAKLITNGIEVIGLETPFSEFDGYYIRASRLFQNIDEIIMSCKSMPKDQHSYVSILCFTKDKGLNAIFGSLDCIPTKISY